MMQLCVAARVEVAAFDQLWAKAAIGTGVLQIIDAAIIANNSLVRIIRFQELRV